MASRASTRVAGLLARLASRPPKAPTATTSRLPANSGSIAKSLVRSFSSGALPGGSVGGGILGRGSFGSSGGSLLPGAEFAPVPFWKRDFSQLGGLGPQNGWRFLVGPCSPASQQLRTIMVEVRRNDLDRAIRQWRRKCKEENLKILKEREYFKKPSLKRVLALKERDRRIAKRAFKVKLNWIMARRQRGF